MRLEESDGDSEDELRQEPPPPSGSVELVRAPVPPPQAAARAPRPRFEPPLAAKPPPPPPSAPRYSRGDPRSAGLGFTIDLDREFESPYRELWSFPNLNQVQSAVFSTAFKTDSNLVLAAPTGTGKTLVLELAIVRLIQEARSTGDSLKASKIVYLAPMKVRGFESREGKGPVSPGAAFRARLSLPSPCTRSPGALPATGRGLGAQVPAALRPQNRRADGRHVSRLSERRGGGPAHPHHAREMGRGQPELERPRESTPAPFRGAARTPLGQAPIPALLSTSLSLCPESSSSWAPCVSS